MTRALLLTYFLRYFYIYILFVDHGASFKSGSIPRCRVQLPHMYVLCSHYFQVNNLDLTTHVHRYGKQTIYSYVGIFRVDKKFYLNTLFHHFLRGIINIFTLSYILKKLFSCSFQSLPLSREIS